MELTRQEHIDCFQVPPQIRDYVERHGDRLTVTQDAFDAVNGYALGIGTTVRIERFAERCSICGYHSIFNPNQKRLIDENRHKLIREFVTIFEWDDYAPKFIPLEEAFDTFASKEGKRGQSFGTEKRETKRP